MGRPFLIGLAAGAAVALGAAAYLPADPPAVNATFPDPAGGGQFSLVINLPGDVLALTHGGGPLIGRFPEAIHPFADASIRHGLALLAVVRDEAGTPVGIASELEFFPEGQHVAADFQWETWWTVFVPGRGTIFLHQMERLGGLLDEVVSKVDETGRDWTGRFSHTTTAGPLPTGHGVIVGGSGLFEGISGYFYEHAELTGYTTDGVLQGQMRLHLTFSDSPPDHVLGDGP